MLRDGKEILYTILFDLRGPLTILHAASQMALDNPAALPPSVITWFQKWGPVINQWIGKERELRQYCHTYPEVGPNWEEMITQLGESLSEIALVESETHTLILSEENETQAFVRQAIRATERLKEMQRLIQSQDYKRFWENRA